MEVNIMTVLKPKDIAQRLGILLLVPYKPGIGREFLKLREHLLIGDFILKIKYSVI